MKPLHLIASKDTNRTLLHHLFVKDGFVYVSNGGALIKLPTQEVFGDVVFEEGEVLLFDATLWANMKFHTAKIIVREGLEFKNLTAGTYMLAKTPKEAQVQVPNFESVLPDKSKPVVACSYITFNPALLFDIAKALGVKGDSDLRMFTFQFYGQDACIEILHNNFPEMACIIMPTLVEGAPVKELIEAPKQINNVPATKGTIGEVLELVDKYNGIKEVILSDYLMDDGLVTELGAAMDNLVEGINKIDVEEEFEEHKTKGVSTDDEEDEASLDDFSEDDILDHLREKDYCIIRIDNLQDRMKLETFVETELYPLLSDRLSKTSI